MNSQYESIPWTAMGHLSEKRKHEVDCVKQHVVFLLKTVSIMLNQFAVSACGTSFLNLMSNEW